MSQTETPQQWLRFSNEDAYDSEEHWSGQQAASEADERLERQLAVAGRVGAIVIVFLFLLAITSAAGYSVGPGNGSRTICEAAGGHMIDRVVVHRCAP